MRASESDRQVVMDRLRQAVEEGRLDVAEYQERMDAALQARVYSELDVLLSDLQSLSPPGYQEVEPVRPTQQMRAGSKANDRLHEDMQRRKSRWKTLGAGGGIALVVILLLLVIFPEFVMYAAIAALVVLVLFVLAAVLGVF
ncbi:DUF1707 domain-containing protein [Glycomyces buryatensis]|uniref:DUF1707 domain-containing protein n=2 Tax=Glycomyces buryatensis TaxID=2570927 RepID=A0A4S8QJD0_9ACTN|nr:DUF1707 domain-containing protein [Glycomyces buryatensis]